MSDERFEIDASRYDVLARYSTPVKRAERKILGREKQIQSIMAAFSRPELCNVILLAPAGSGKALSDDELIAVNDERGYVRMGDIAVDDEVFDEMGNPTRVLGVYPQGLKRAYRVTFANGASIVCNDEHLWCVRDQWSHRKNKPYDVMTLSDMMAKGINQQKAMPSGSVHSEHQWFVPRAGAVDRKDATLPVPPYALGAFIATGCWNLHGDDLLAMTLDDSFVADKVACLLGAVAQRADAACDWVFRSLETGHLLCVDDVFADVMFDGTICARIWPRIPQEYFIGSARQRFELLQGLLDVNGSITGNGEHVSVNFSTSNTGLARDFQMLAASLGIVTNTIHVNHHDVLDMNHECMICISVPDDVKFDLFTFPKHLTRLTERMAGCESNDRYDDMAIIDVHDMGVEIPMTCIYVEAESHLFQAGLDHIVTHNTALVQATMLVDTERTYLDIDVSKMIAENGADTLGAELKVLFDQTKACVDETGHEIVLFIDEFHKIINVSEAAVEDLKPLLADSGTRGIRVLAATTLEEFNKYISANQPLVERLQRINVPEPDEDLTVAILKGMAERYGVANQFYNDHIYHRIYEYTNRYIPANSQPRKSILVLDAMVGWHRFAHRRLDERLLADVIMESEDVNVAFRVDASKVKQALDAKVLDQGYASLQISKRLQLCVADLNDKSKPMSTFLFTGSTGVGKALTVDTLVPMIDEAGNSAYKPAGEVEVGDMLFSRTGEPTRVLGVFPQGKRQVYRVTFEDGRVLDVSDNHLWAVYPAKRPRDCEPTIYSTKALLERGLETRHHDRVAMKYFVPAAYATQWPTAELPVPPYAMGALIGDGCLSAEDALVMSSDDESVVSRVASELGVFAKRTGDYTWTFYVEPPVDGARGRRVKQVDVLGAIDGVYRVKSPERRVPEVYMLASVEQRWDLVRGLFDTDGTIGQADGDRFNVSYSTMSKGLADDVRRLLNSLGVSATVSAHVREGKNTEYHVHVRIANANKADFFYLPRKRDVAARATGVAKQREKSFNYVGIRSIEPLDCDAEMVCFYVDNDEHLFQAGDHIVTHNTEMTKQLAQVLFGDTRRLIRFDMTEYANSDTLERFRDLLTTRVWEHPYSIILLDEIEKACPEVTRLLLQVLDDGRLTNRNNREISFTNAYIVLTTNAGSEIYQTVAQYATGDGDEELKSLADEMGQMERQASTSAADDEEWVERYDKLIRRSISQTQGANRFPPELLGRIDMIVPFKPLSRSTMRKIVKMRLQRLQKEVLSKHNIQVAFDFDNVIAYLVDDKLDTDSNSGGARIVMSVLERDVTTAIARHINEHPPVTQKLLVTVDDPSLMAIASKTRLKSEAHIIVGEPR